jgi:hypothetical protein
MSKTSEVKKVQQQIKKLSLDEFDKIVWKEADKEVREEFKDTTAEDMNLMASHQLALDMKKIKRVSIIKQRLKEYFTLSNPSSIDECKLLLAKYATIIDYCWRQRLLSKHITPIRAILLIYLHLRDKLEELQGHKTVIPND